MFAAHQSEYRVILQGNTQSHCSVIGATKEGQSGYFPLFIMFVLFFLLSVSTTTNQADIWCRLDNYEECEGKLRK